MLKYLCLLLLLLPGSAMVLSGQEVFLVPGWRTGYSGRDGCVRIMRDIWPGSDITVKSWNSLVSYSEAKKNAAEYTKVLLKELLDMPESRRRELIIVGHSIGADITVNILCSLAERNMTIREVALLGAALPYDDPRVWQVLKAVRGRCYNVVFPGDAVLRLLYSFSEGSSPLGAKGWKFSHSRFVEANIEKNFSFYNHYAYLYLEQLDALVDSLPPYPVDIRVMYGCQPYPFDEKAIYWDEVELFQDWKLQKHRVSGEYRIVDDRNLVRARGKADLMQQSFADVKRQLPPGMKK